MDKRHKGSTLINKTPKWYIEAVNRSRTNNRMAKRQQGPTLVYKTPKWYIEAVNGSRTNNPMAKRQQVSTLIYTTLLKLKFEQNEDNYIPNSELSMTKRNNIFDEMM